jgi:pimeloyl-ACP methyl ester carboxylesterase
MRLIMHSDRHEILLALIGTIGTIGAAALACPPAVFAQRTDKSGTIPTDKKGNSMTTATPATAATRTETFDHGLTITFTERGEGPRLLVLHGGAGPMSVARFAETMSATHRVLTPTQPGFAGTVRPDGFRNIEDVAQTYIELLDRHDLKNVLVVGHSMGGWVAAEMAARAGDRLRGIVLVGAGGFVVEGESCADVFALTPQQLSALSYHDPVTYGIDPSKMSPEQKAGMAANFAALAVYGRERNMQDPTLRGRLASVTTPALVIWGASDRVVTPAYGRAYASAFPNGRFELIEKCGHLPQFEQPARLLELVHSFDASLKDRA